MTDDTVATAAVVAAEGTNSSGTPPLFLIRCDEGRVGTLAGPWSAGVLWSDFINNERHPVEYRIGTGEPQEGLWDVSTDFEYTFVPWTEMEQFVPSLYGQTQLVVRTTPYADTPITAVFDISGIDHAVLQVGEACGQF